MPFKLSVFAVFILIGWICIAVYTPYHWGSDLVAEEIAMQELVPKNLMGGLQGKAERKLQEREDRITQIKKYFPVSRRDWLWNDPIRQFSVVRKGESGQLCMGERELADAIRSFKAEHPIQPFTGEKYEEITIDENPPFIKPSNSRFGSEPDEVAAILNEAAKKRKGRKVQRETLAYTEYLKSLPPEPILFSTTARRSLALAPVIVEGVIVLVLAVVVAGIADLPKKKKTSVASVANPHVK